MEHKPLSLKFVVVLRTIPKPTGFVIPFQIDDYKKVLRKFGELHFCFCDYKI